MEYLKRKKNHVKTYTRANNQTDTDTDKESERGMSMNVSNCDWELLNLA